MGHVHVLHLPPTLESDRPWSPEPSKKEKKKKKNFVFVLVRAKGTLRGRVGVAKLFYLKYCKTAYNFYI